MCGNYLGGLTAEKVNLDGFFEVNIYSLKIEEHDYPKLTAVYSSLHSFIYPF